jgi:hypothetical protein
MTSEYLGSGWLALLRAEEEDERREARKSERAEFREMVARDDELDQALAELAAEAMMVARRELEENGFHQHCRGRWRRRRVRRSEL